MKKLCLKIILGLIAVTLTACQSFSSRHASSETHLDTQAYRETGTLMIVLPRSSEPTSSTYPVSGN